MRASCSLSVVVALVACRPTPSPHDGPPDTEPPKTSPRVTSTAPEAGLDAALGQAPLEAGATTGGASSDPMKYHAETREDLLALFSVKDFTEQEKKTIRPDEFLRSMFNTDGPMHANQGNKALAQHS